MLLEDMSFEKKKKTLNPLIYTEKHFKKLSHSRAGFPKERGVWKRNSAAKPAYSPPLPLSPLVIPPSVAARSQACNMIRPGQTSHCSWLGWEVQTHRENNQRWSYRNEVSPGLLGLFQ